MKSLSIVSSLLLTSRVLAQAYTNESDPFYGQSPPVYPTPEGNGGVDPSWQAAYARARDLVSQMTLEEKVNMTRGHTGTCVGTTFNISRLDVPPLW